MFWHSIVGGEKAGKSASHAATPARMPIGWLAPCQSERLPVPE
jgi:hypothetical protein